MADDINLAIEVLRALSSLEVWRLHDRTIVVADEHGYRTVTPAELGRLATAALAARSGTAEGQELDALVRGLGHRDGAWRRGALPAGAVIP
jgi:hypothetical protein